MANVKEAIEEVIEESYLLNLTAEEIRRDFEKFIDTCFLVIKSHVQDRDTLAGLNKEQVDVEVSSRTVSIAANSERKNFKWEETFKYELDPESTKATMVNGILDLVIEKKEKTSSKKVEIE